MHTSNKYEIKGSGDGLKYCNDCPFFTIEAKDNSTIVYTCLPNDYKLGESVGKEIKIKVPNWCGNKDKSFMSKFLYKLRKFHKKVHFIRCGMNCGCF